MSDAFRAEAAPRRLRFRTALFTAATLAAALAAWGARAAADARMALVAGAEAETNGDRREALRHYRDAARSYLPASRVVARALASLDRLATQAEAAGDLVSARAAIEAVRASALGSRWLLTPRAASLPRIEARLARLYARTEEPLAAGESLEARTAWHAARLARHPGARPPYVLLSLAGLGLWLGGAIGFFLRGLDCDLGLRARPALVAGVAFLAGVSIFLVGLRCA